jgi:hypothetical protein
MLVSIQTLSSGQARGSALRRLCVIAGAGLALAGCASVPFIGRDRNAPPEGASSPAPATPDDALPTTQQGFFGRLLGGREAPNAGPCPAVRVLYDASRFVEVTGDEVFANVGYTGEIQAVRAFCRYAGVDPIRMEVEVDFAFGKGPRAQGSGRPVRYWVAVTRRDIAPIARQDFTVNAAFPAGADRVAVTNTLTEIVIPRANKDISGANFEVLIGFELTPEQLQFNRDGKRFRVDAGQGRG